VSLMTNSIAPVRGMLRQLWYSGRSARLQNILLSIEEKIHRRSTVEAVLEALEASKRPILECLSKRAVSSVAPKALTLKILNLLLCKHHLRARSSIVLSRPFGLAVDPSNVCNLACPGCVHSQHAKEQKIFIWGQGMLSEDRLAALLKCYGPCAIHTTFCNYGEPLVNPNTPKYIRQAKNYLMRTMVSTSLSLPHFDAEAYVESGLDFMVVSIDGATQPVYERFRKKGNLDLVLHNLRKLVEAKRRLAMKTPVIAWHYLAFEHNVHEIHLAMETAGNLGANQFTTLVPFDVTWDDPGIHPAAIQPGTVEFGSNDDSMLKNWNPFPDTLDEETIEQEFEVRWSERAADVVEEAARSGSTCHWLYKSMTMDAGGRIFPCCGAPTPDKDLIFANFAGKTASELFNSEKHRLARLFFRDPKAYQEEREAGNLDRDPHCVDCEWNKTTANTDRTQIRNYLRAAGADLFTSASVNILSSW
jgi:sulfatase maturation enzyme AslB (radical SAM superfamily)